MQYNNKAEQWGLWELELTGPEVDNPFVNVELFAFFSIGGIRKKVRGFYDGNRIYRIRFCPELTGEWVFETRSNVKALDGLKGGFTVADPSPSNHGPVQVQGTYRFAYADGTPFIHLGTTCYAWLHQPEELIEETLKTLSCNAFNKLRFCVFPKEYEYCRNEPDFYPYEGTATDNWDFSRFNPAFFQHLEKGIMALQKLNIEADIILFHPYDNGHWGFDRMSSAADDLYLRYVVSRFAAYRNVWWSMANEFDLMREKSMTDWDRFLEIVKTEDPYSRLRSIHNGPRYYNQTSPLVTHASIQCGFAVEEPLRAVIYRDIIRKPIVMDEIKYEGDIPYEWGNISAMELVHRFWTGVVSGVHLTHGETFKHPDDILWWAKGGKLHGQSPERLAFLRQVLTQLPDEDFVPCIRQPGIAKVGSYCYVYYPGRNAVNWKFRLWGPNMADGTRFSAEIIDTWNMTRQKLETVFETIHYDGDLYVHDKDGRSIDLSEFPYSAVILTKINEGDCT